MKSKMMIISSSYYVHGALYVETLLEYYDVYFTGNLSNPSYEYNFDQDLLNRHVKLDIFAKNIKEYKIIFGVDNRTAGYLNYLKKNVPTIKTAIQILDYPKHVFKTNKNYNPHVHKMWDDYIGNSCFSNMDFVIHNQKIAMEELKSVHPQAKCDFIKFPVNPFKFDDKEFKNKPANEFHKKVSQLEYKQNDFIIYSGKVSPDKGVNYIIDALSILEEDIELITIGGGIDYSEYAKNLNVRYQNIKCSEKEKWQLYRESRFLICGADNEYIPTLCILEGISVGKTGIVFNTEENELHYGPYAIYVKMQDIHSLANGVKFLWNNSQIDLIAKYGPEYYEKECSYKAWAKKVYDLIGEQS